MPLFRTLLCLLLCLALPASVRAEDAPLRTALAYEVTWNGLHVAELVVGISGKNPSSTEMRAVITGGRITQVAGGYRSDTRAVLRYKGADVYLPVNYHTTFTLRKKTRDIRLRYAADGGRIIAETNTPPEIRGKRAAVPKEMQRGVYDPLSLALAVREKVMELMQGGQGAGSQFSFPMYDGRRRSVMEFTLGERMKDGIIPLGMTETPVAGYTKTEMQNFDKEKKRITFYLSSDRYLPIRAEGTSFLGTSWVKLVKECKTLEECL